MRTTILLNTLVAIVLVGAAVSASAADTEEQKVLVRAQRMLRQMSLERDTALAENAKLKNELEQTKGKLTGVKKSSEVALAKSRESNTALSDDLRQTNQKLHQAESEKGQLQEMVNGQAELIQSCDAKNAELVKINRDVVARYEKKGFFDALLQREPLTQLKRVEIENIAQDYQDEIDRQEFKKNTASAAAR